MYNLYGGPSFPLLLVWRGLIAPRPAPASLILASVFLYQYVNTPQGFNAAHSLAQTSRLVRVRGIRCSCSRVAGQQLCDTTNESDPEEHGDVTRQAHGRGWGAVQSGTKSDASLLSAAHTPDPGQRLNLSSSSPGRICGHRRCCERGRRSLCG